MFSPSGINRADQLAYKIIGLSKEELIAIMPYMSRVLLNLPVILHDPEKDPEAEIHFGTDGKAIHSFGYMIIETYTGSMEQMTRMLLHSLLHCLFSHMYNCREKDEKLWNLSTDMAVESLILDLHMDTMTVSRDDFRRDLLAQFFPDSRYRNAESVYAYLQIHPDIRDQAMESAWLFQQDRHDLWYTSENAVIRKTDEIRKEVEQAALDYENARGLKPGSVSRKLHLHTDETKDYSQLLQRFLDQEEEVRTDPDSFDYILYTYGLQKYHDMPLIEPLEVQESNRIHDFVIAVDTSASCQGRKVISFLRETRSVLSSQLLSGKMNVHIIQCDAAIQEEVTINSLEEYDAYLKDMIMHGSGGTDYRPVFQRISEELQEGLFHHLQGLIYFTDGNGTYPPEAPSYRTAFILDPSESTEEIPFPSWAVRILMNGETE